MMVRISSNLGDLLTGTLSKTNETIIRELLENWAESVQRKDYDGILAKHSQDIVIFDLPARHQSKGIEAYKKNWNLFFCSYRDAPSFKICEMSISVDKDVAVAHALVRCAGTHQNGLRSNLDFRLTVGLSNLNGQWIVTHEHHSIPVE